VVGDMARRFQLPALRTPKGVPGLLYEPRAFWSVGSVDTNGAPAGAQSLILPRNDFLNGEKYPITVTKLTLMPVNYWVQALTTPIANSYHVVGDANMNEPQVLISAPQRQQLGRAPMRLTGPCAQPTWEPEIKTSLGGAGGADPLIYASSIWNTVRWDFDKPMILPQDGAMTIEFGGVSAPDAPGDPPDMTINVGVYEGPQPGTDQPGSLLLPGNVRSVQNAPLEVLPIAAIPYAQPEVIAGAVPAKAAGFTAQIFKEWQPQSRLSSAQYKRQKASSGAGSNPVSGFAVHIDQIDYDDGYATNPITPMSMRLPSRARMTDGGTGAWWWRPGAPLALVCPTITPALVYDLPEPITLGPGDDLEVEIQTPGPVTVGGTPETPVYQVGVGLCGYAAIEG
jgi:hypothetical protein